VCKIVFVAVMLFQQDISLTTVPHARPVLVGPAQAKGQIRLTGGKHLIERTFQNALAVEPVVVVAKSIDTMFPCQFGLGLTRFLQAQVVKTQISGQVWLVMPRKQWFGLCYIAPFGETSPPPLVILRDSGTEGGRRQWHECLTLLCLFGHAIGTTGLNNILNFGLNTGCIRLQCEFLVEALLASINKLSG